jgi:hypothetical protein
VAADADTVFQNHTCRLNSKQAQNIVAIESIAIFIVGSLLGQKYLNTNSWFFALTVKQLRRGGGLNLRSIFSFLRIMKMPGLFPIIKDWQALIRIHFLFAAYESG